MTNERRKWKPGDVVTATVNGRENVRLVAGWSKYEPHLRWCEMSPRWADGDDDECWFMPSAVKDHRRLVAIDPDDREEVGALALLLRSQYKTVTFANDDLRGALREFADRESLKPDEPMGKWAVVEAFGVIYIRAGWASEKPWSRVGTERWDAWHEMDVTDVISQGVLS